MEMEKMSRSSSLMSKESFESAIELMPTDRSTDGNGRCFSDENQDCKINKKSGGKNSHVFKDHKCCLLIATIVFIMFIVFLSIFIIINYNRCEPTREYSFVSGNCTNCTKENKTEEKESPSKEVKDTEFQVTLWDSSMTVIIKTHETLSLQLSRYDDDTTMMICRNNRTSYELFCNSQAKRNCQSVPVPVNKSVTIRNETQDEQIIFNIVAKCINQKVGIKWINI
ncbi:uncharacterized protein LOC127729640 [Mytilus californianus]|uniref:uncharacterized protein LOC127729640 n=1 Tax=Mytilus californianus TaxID=6549 RepID=UPI0022456D2D|nr:uncharacterized protein LOC127729640 [Mytilus californianus]